MRKVIYCLLLVASALLWTAASFAEEQAGIVAKVITEKGALKLRCNPEDKARVLYEIPNGTCILVLMEGDEWCQVAAGDQVGFCKTAFLTFLREADVSILKYRILRKGMKGDDVLNVKRRLKELGYIRSGSELTNTYNDVLKERIILFQRQVGMTEDGVLSQELQAYLFSDRAPACTQTLPKVRSRVPSRGTSMRVICGCCMGDGCECCDFSGYINGPLL